MSGSNWKKKAERLFIDAPADFIARHSRSFPFGEGFGKATNSVRREGLKDFFFTTDDGEGGQ